MSIPKSILSFVESIGRLSTDNYEQFQKIIREAASKYHCHRVELLRVYSRDDTLRLRPVFWDGDQYDDYPVKNPDGSPHGLNAHAYMTKKPAWIISKIQDRPLIQCPSNSLIDLLDLNRNDFPQFVRVHAYQRQIPVETKTVIIIPGSFFDTASTDTIVYFESEKHLHPNGLQLHELFLDFKAFEASVRKAYFTKEETENRRRDTKESLLKLEQSIMNSLHVRLGSIRLFLAYPDQLAERVLLKLKDAIRNSSTTSIEIIDWKKLEHLGPIDAQIFGAIKTADIFVGILNTEDGEIKPNILIEAAAFSDYTNNRFPVLAWKGDPNTLPFDIRGWRIIPIKQWEGTELEEWVEELQRAIMQQVYVLDK